MGIAAVSRACSGGRRIDLLEEKLDAILSKLDDQSV